MEETVEEVVKQVWQTWNIRGLVLTSLLIQFLLTFLAPLRRRYASGFLKIFLWLLYLSADAIALFTIGLISSAVRSDIQHQYADLLAFWAPFLLLHLGGPDTITALALEDNELWHRHALQFATQISVTVYVFAHSFQHNTAGLLFSTLLMFVDGCMKYLERTGALYEASIGRFRDCHRNKPKTSPYYARLMEEYRCAEAASIPAQIQAKNAPSASNNNTQRSSQESTRGGRGLTCTKSWYYSPTGVFGARQQWDQHHHENDNVIRAAYHFFMNFRGIIADALLSSEDRDESRKFFLNIKDAPKAFKMVEIELNFIYDIFYTKAFLVTRKRGWARLLSFIFVVISLLIFCFKDKSKYPHKIDVRITFTLLGGAMAKDIIGLIMFLLSDWFIILLPYHGKDDQNHLIIEPLVRLLINWSIWVRNHCQRSYHGRWSQSIIKYNLLKHCCLDKKDNDPTTANPVTIRIKDGIKNFVLERILHIHTTSSSVNQQMGNFIFQELKKKAELAIDPESIKEVCSARGNLALQDDCVFVSEYLQPWTVDIDYDDSLLTWHLATDLCYWTMDATDRDRDQYCKISKDISDYMSYLFLKQKTMVSPVLGASDIRFQDTCADAYKFMNDSKRSLNDQDVENILEQFCTEALQAEMVVWSSVAKIEESKSVFFEACHLAKQLNMFGTRQWEITAKVWLELLSYAALRCSPRSHVAELSNGGQLITFVWLLMAHLGLGERFRQARAIAWTKLKIQK